MNRVRNAGPSGTSRSQPGSPKVQIRYSALDADDRAGSGWVRCCRVSWPTAGIGDDTASRWPGTGDCSMTLRPGGLIDWIVRRLSWILLTCLFCRSQVEMYWDCDPLGRREDVDG